MLVQIVVKPRIGVIHDILLAILGRVGVVRPHSEGDGNDHDDKVCQKNEIAVVNIEEELRKANTDGKTLLSIGISVFLIIFLGSGVGKGLIRLCHHHKHRLGRGIVGVLVRMVFQTHLFVCLLDFFELGSRINTKNGKGIERVNLSIGLDGHVQPHEDNSEDHSEDKVEDEAGGVERFEALARFLQVSRLLFLRRCAGDGTNFLISGE
mmetsp:Transcript_4820/g.10970  ORF Transcript_4820/g.10970 Transcript_4820/m.10970 type:complete len:208 (-) Transcript_4820:306-929(-)